MPRTPRQEAPGAIHHVIANGNAGETIVRDDVDRAALFARLGRTVERHRWSCLAYCFLDTHFHLIVRTPEPNLGQGMKALEAPYAQNFNHRHERQGHLFRGRFYSKRIESESHLVAAIIYVSLNPVRAGVVDRPELWRWSSYGATIGLVSVPTCLDIAGVLELIDPLPATARLALEIGVRDARDRDRVMLGV